MEALPGLPEVRSRLPDPGTSPPSVTRTRSPVMVRLLIWLVPVTSNVRVTLVEVTEIVGLEISLPLGPEILADDAEPTPGFSCQPLGAVRINVRADPVAISPFAASVMTMLPRVE